VLIFSQPWDREAQTIDSQDPKWVQEHIKEYVLPHEIGHHKALYHAGITDKSLSVAEARADANVIGMDPTDRDVDLLQREEAKVEKQMQREFKKEMRKRPTKREEMMSPEVPAW
jgi:hypothetical protein